MILPPVTPTQSKLVTYTYRFRFLSRLHYQLFLHHRSPSLIKTWLADLTTKQYLVSERSVKFGENTKPTVYHTGINSIRLVKTMDEIASNSLQYLYHESSRSQIFKTHCLTLADFCGNLLQHARSQKKSITFFTKTDYRKEEVEDKTLQLLHIINPDGYYSFSGTGVAKQCFIEIIDEITPAFVVRGKVRKYIRCFQDESWEEQLNTVRFPSIAFLVPNGKKLHSLRKAITRVKNEFDDETITAAIRCNVALAADIKIKSIAENIWKQG